MNVTNINKYNESARLINIKIKNLISATRVLN